MARIVLVQRSIAVSSPTTLQRSTRRGRAIGDSNASPTPLDSLRVSSYAVRRLVQLFERAKFSPHEVGPSMKDDAIEALAGLRSELEVERMQAA